MLMQVDCCTVCHLYFGQCVISVSLLTYNALYALCAVCSADLLGYSGAGAVFGFDTESQQMVFTLISPISVPVSAIADSSLFQSDSADDSLTISLTLVSPPVFDKSGQWFYAAVQSDASQMPGIVMISTVDGSVARVSLSTYSALGMIWSPTLPPTVHGSGAVLIATQVSSSGSSCASCSVPKGLVAFSPDLSKRIWEYCPLESGNGYTAAGNAAPIALSSNRVLFVEAQRNGGSSGKGGLQTVWTLLNGDDGTVISHTAEE